MDGRPRAPGRRLAALFPSAAFCGRSGRTLGLLLGLFWGAAIAFVQLRLTWELTEVAGFTRNVESLRGYVFPPAHAPVCIARGFPGAARRSHRRLLEPSRSDRKRSLPYVGIVPFIFAIVGFVGLPRRQSWAPGA